MYSVDSIDEETQDEVAMLVIIIRSYLAWCVLEQTCGKVANRLPGTLKLLQITVIQKVANTFLQFPLSLTHKGGHFMEKSKWKKQLLYLESNGAIMDSASVVKLQPRRRRDVFTLTAEIDAPSRIRQSDWIRRRRRAGDMSDQIDSEDSLGATR